MISPQRKKKENRPIYENTLQILPKTDSKHSQAQRKLTMLNTCKHVCILAICPDLWWWHNCWATLCTHIPRTPVFSLIHLCFNLLHEASYLIQDFIDEFSWKEMKKNTLQPSNRHVKTHLHRLKCAHRFPHVLYQCVWLHIALVFFPPCAHTLSQWSSSQCNRLSGHRFIRSGSQVNELY